MSALPLTLRLLEGELAVVRLEAASAVPPWLDLRAEPLAAIVRTAEELSIVCPASMVPPDARAASGWRAFHLLGSFDFGQVGILAAILKPLAEAGVGIFALSTFDTDYILVQSAQLDRARTALAAHFRME